MMSVLVISFKFLATLTMCVSCRSEQRQQLAGEGATAMQEHSMGSFGHSSMQDGSLSSSCSHSSATDDSGDDSTDDTAVHSSAVSQTSRRVTLAQQSNSSASTHAYAYRSALPPSDAALCILSLAVSVCHPCQICQRCTASFLAET